MGNGGPSDVPSEAEQERHANGFLGFLREVSLGVVVAGAVCSVGLMLRAGRNTPRMLLFLFVIWIMSPFVALLWANLNSKHWSLLTRATLYCMTIIITLVSLAIYGGIISPPAGLPPAFIFVVVPPGSWLLMAV